MKTKSEIRKEILLIRDNLDKETIYDYSKSICFKILESDNYKKSKIVLAYIPTRGEVDVFPIINDAYNSGKKVYIPKVLGKHEMEFYMYNGIKGLIKGKYNILEPKEECKFVYDGSTRHDVVMIVPGVAYDTKGNRLGYGGGFYDTYLEGKDLYTYAPAYDFQIVDAINTEKHDKRIDEIVTE